MTKETFLHDCHVKLGAKMVDFAGWHMPVQYASIIEEHNHVRKSVGIFDVSHMGEVVYKGKDVIKFLNKMVPQNIDKLTDGKAVYCQLPNKEGGLIDDLIIYRLDEQKFLIVHNAARVDEDVNWMSRNIGDFDVEIINESHNYSMIAVQGPKAVEYMELLGLRELPSFFSIKKDTLFGYEVWVSRTGYTGEDGVELIMKNKYAVPIWEGLLANSNEIVVKPIGLGARDTLRLEAALHLYGNDLDETTTPVEAGLSWSIPKDKMADYNGKAIIESQLKNGVKKKLVGLKMIDKGIARHGYEVFFNGEKIGVVTSGSISPTRGDNIALAYIKNLDNLSVGSTIQISIRDKFYNAEIIKKPFIQKRNKV